MVFEDLWSKVHMLFTLRASEKSGCVVVIYSVTFRSTICVRSCSEAFTFSNNLSWWGFRPCI